MRTQLNTTIPTESSAAEEISISATSKATTEQKRRRRDDEERNQTEFNSKRSNTNFLIFGAQKWGPSVPGEARAKNCNFKKHQVVMLIIVMYFNG